MCRGPLQRGTFQGHGAEYQENEFDNRMSGEAAMCKHTMEADGDAKGNKGVHNEEKGEVCRVNSLLPERGNRVYGSGERSNNRQENYAFVRKTCLQKNLQVKLIRSGEQFVFFFH